MARHTTPGKSCSCFEIIHTISQWNQQDRPTRIFSTRKKNLEQEAVDNLDFANPFAALDVGEYGADVCLHRDDIACSFPNEDLRLIRVKLTRNATSGGSIRGHSSVMSWTPILGTTPTWLGGCSAISRPTRVSALLHAAVPPAFIRLDNPDDENLVTKVMSLDLNISKVELLITLGRVAQHDDFTQENLDSMEGAMDTAAQLVADAATQYVRENFL
ncbi:hypothetical protein [Haloarcula hispanica]|uniref:hypothetical protein n=1 Tax=Haloarcula hispanica TaxID=51589 RepID=UPI001F5D47F6|nr:hypothetical protein [Haloarcula hispanica]